MLYLFGSGAYKSDRKIVKVGFTDDISTRKGQYLLHNPLGEFLGEREGDKVLELKLHLRLGDWRVEFLEEWFYDEPEVEEIFGEDEVVIDKWLWDNRETCLIQPGLPEEGTLKRRIYDQLSQRYQGTSLGQKSI